MEIEVADRRPNRLGLQGHQHDEVVGLPELDSSVRKRGLEGLLSGLLRVEARHASRQLDVGQEQPGRGEVVMGEPQSLVRIRLLGHSPADTPGGPRGSASTGSSRHRRGAPPSRLDR